MIRSSEQRVQHTSQITEKTTKTSKTSRTDEHDDAYLNRKHVSTLHVPHMTNKTRDSKQKPFDMDHQQTLNL